MTIEVMRTACSKRDVGARSVDRCRKVRESLFVTFRHLPDTRSPLADAPPALLQALSALLMQCIHNMYVCVYIYIYVLYIYIYIYTHILIHTYMHITRNIYAIATPRRQSRGPPARLSANYNRKNAHESTSHTNSQCNQDSSTVEEHVAGTLQTHWFERSQRRGPPARRPRPRPAPRRGPWAPRKL